MQRSMRDPVLDFVNRRAEKQVVDDFCDGRLGRKQCLILKGSRDSGVTFFLEHLARTSDPKWFCVYADCRSNDPDAIFRKFFDKVEAHWLLRWNALSVVRELGEALFRFVAGLLVGGAWAPAGPAVAAIIPKVATTPYASASSERFATLVTSGRWKRPVLFLVDNAQEIKPQSLHILSTAFAPQYDHVRFLLAFVGDDVPPTAWDELLSRLHGYGLDVQTMDFPPPDSTFVNEIAAALGATLSATDREQLLRDGRASTVIATLSGATHGRSRLTATEREVLRYLLVAEQPLRRDDVCSVVRSSPRLEASDTAVLKAIDALARHRLITLTPHWLGVEIEIAPGRHRFVEEAVSAVAGDLVASQELYRYFTTVQRVRSERHAPSAYGALLYRLAQVVDPASLPVRAFDLVRISLGQADLTAAKKYVDDAISHAPARTAANLYTLLAFHVSVQEYEEAAKILDDLGVAYWSRVQMLRIIHAVIENRLRRHAESNLEIDLLLQEPSLTHEEFALLISYKVAAHVHDGDLALARETFEATAPRIRRAHNRGYALRNCAAVYCWGEAPDLASAERVLQEAAATFRDDDDKFGYYTTLNNRGALAACSTDRNAAVAAALPLFQESFEALSVYGAHHLEEVGANLGIALLLNGRPAQAATHLRKMIAISSFDFPRVIMECALAVAETQLGDASAAALRMREVLVKVEGVHLPEATFWASANAAAIEGVTVGASHRFEALVSAARASDFWGGENSLARLVGSVLRGSLTPDLLPTVFGFDLLQYWSQNPLSVVTPSPLPQQAIRDNMSE